MRRRARPTTPHIDALAKKSAVFENAMAQISWCLPNYASLFTGQPPEVHGLYTNRFRGVPEFEATLAEKLRGSGYATAAFSGGVYLLKDWGLDRGFDEYVNAFSTSDASRLAFELLKHAELSRPHAPGLPEAPAQAASVELDVPEKR